MSVFGRGRCSSLLWLLSLPQRADLHRSAALLHKLQGKRVERPDFKQLQQQADETIKSAISHGKSMCASDWDSIAAEYRVHVPGARLDVIDHRALLLCKELDNFSAARTLIHHRKTSNAAIPAATLSLYLEVAGCCGKSDARADADVLDLHRQLSGMPLDTKSAGRVMLGLCGTRHWRLALEYLPQARQHSFRPVEVITALSAAAFRHGDPELGWSLMEELADDLVRPGDEAFDAWLTQCEIRARLESRARLSSSAGNAPLASLEPAGETAADMVQRVLTFLERSSLLLTEQQARRLKQLCDSRLVDRWTAEGTQLSGRGQCERCGLVLPEAVLSDEDFEEVRNALVEHVLIGEDVFQQSSPEEVERFRSFVAKTAPYDVVIDGLNISFILRQMKGGKPLNSVLHQAVNHFAVKEGKKVLVIGRYHMKGWSKNDLGFVKRHALLFTADNMSADDAFLLYAVMHSHKRTEFVTRDFFRDHAARLPATTRTKFNQLVRANRIEVAGVAKGGTVNFMMPPRYFVRAQTDPYGGWHIPFTERPPGQVVTRNAAVVDTDRWLCMRPNTVS